MTRINTNISSLVAQNRLRSSNESLQTALTRLSTGLRINNGSDDPAGLIASEALRSEVTSLGKAISNTRRAVQIINTADSALGEVSSLLNDIRGLVTEAANTGALSPEEISANQLQIDSSLEAINRIAQTTTFQGRKLLDGSLDFVTTANTVDSIADLKIDQANLGATGKIDVDVVIDTPATQAQLTVGATAFEIVPASASTPEVGGRSLLIQGNLPGDELNDVTIEFVDDTTTVAGSHGDNPPAAVYDDVNKVLTVTFNSAAATAANEPTYGNIEAAIDVPTVPFDASLPTGTAATDPFDVPADDLNTERTGGTELKDDVVFQINGTSGAETFNFAKGTDIKQVEAAINLVQDATGIWSSIDAGTLMLQSAAYGSESLVAIDVITEEDAGEFESSLSVVRATGTDVEAFVNGVRADARANTFSINTSSLDLEIIVDDASDTDFQFSITDGGALFQIGPDVVTTQQARLGITSLSTGQLGGASGRLYELGSGNDKSLTKDVTNAAKIIDEVIDKVTSLRGRLGAFQSTTLNSNLVSLNETMNNLQEAESSIRDADFAMESANLTRTQILVQSGTNVLSLANQAPQNVLSLLQ